MSSQNSQSSKPLHHLALLSYCYSLLRKRRVLLMGDDFSLASFIREAGSLQVVAVSADAPVSPWPSLKGRRGMAHQIMPPGDLQFSNGAFDMAVVPDLTRLTDPDAVVSELRRVVDPDGYLIIQAPNPDGQCETRTIPNRNPCLHSSGPI